MSNGWTYNWYRIFRYALGTYLMVHFGLLLPYGAELFSNAGVIPTATDSPLIHAFPNILAWVDSPNAVTLLLVMATGVSILFCAGIFDRASALFLWFMLASLLGRNPLIANPSLPYVGWMLLAHVVIPKKKPADWTMPNSIYAAAWIVLAVGYSYSGISKLWSPSWVDGTAFRHLLNNPLSRPGIVRELLLAAPPIMFSLATWGALAAEILFAPLALIKRVRPYIWGTMLTMHLGLLCLVDFADLSFGMILIHAFTFNPNWLPAHKLELPSS